jgi:hypothetical protein
LLQNLINPLPIKRRQCDTCHEDSVIVIVTIGQKNVKGAKALTKCPDACVRKYYVKERLKPVNNEPVSKKKILCLAEKQYQIYEKRDYILPLNSTSNFRFRIA